MIDRCMIEYLTEYMQDLCDDCKCEHRYDMRYRFGYIDALNDVRTAIKEYIEQEEQEAVLAANNAANNIAKSEAIKQRAYQQTANEYRRIRTEASLENIENLDIGLAELGFDNKSIQAITRDIDDLGITVKRVTTSLNDAKIHYEIFNSKRGFSIIADDMDKIYPILNTIRSSFKIKSWLCRPVLLKYPKISSE